MTVLQATTPANNFSAGFHDAWPYTAVFGKPTSPDSPSRSYGLGMAAAGAAAIGVGAVPLVGALILRSSGQTLIPRAASNIAVIGAGLFTLIHSGLGIAGLIGGLSYASAGSS